MYPQTRILRKAYVTLLELLIVIAVLALIGGALVYNIGNAVIDQRFRTEVGRVVDILRLAQDLMLILGTDVHVKFAQDEAKGGIHYWIEMETALEGPWEKEIKRPLNNLKTIRGVFLKDLATDNYIQGQIDVKFLSRGSLMSRGMMRLATSTEDNPIPPGTLENYICLPGYPHSIYSTDNKEDDKACQLKDDEQDLMLTISTVEKIPEKIRGASEQSQEEENAPTSEDPNPEEN